MLNGNGHQPPAPQPQAFDGATMVPITLQIVTWNLILTQLAEGPWKTVDSLIKELHKQIQATLEKTPAVAPQTYTALDRPES